MKKLDLKGKKFGRLEVLSEHPERTTQGLVRWNCKCDCGKELIVIGRNLPNGNSKSCGCVAAERLFKMVYKDGRSYDPDYELRLRLRRKYNITLEHYNSLFILQDNKCKICDSEFNIKNPQTINVDHCHKTGKIRGILCNSCNTALGSFKDDVVRLQKAIDYLNAETY